MYYYFIGSTASGPVYLHRLRINALGPEYQHGGTGVPTLNVGPPSGPGSKQNWFLPVRNLLK